MAIIDRYGWKVLAWRGGVSILFGLMALALPGLTLALFIVLFGAYAFIDGVLTLDASMRAPDSQGRWLFLFAAIFSIGVGLATFFWPGIALLGLVFAVGIRALVLGILEIAAAWSLRGVTTTASLYGLGGLITLLAGVLTLVLPIVSARLLVTVFGVYALFFGGALLALGLWLRGQKNKDVRQGGVPLVPETA